MDGKKPGTPYRLTVHDAAQGAAAVDSLARLGVDFINVPRTVTPSEASNAGQRSIEHIATIFEGTFSAAHPGGSEQQAARRASLP